MGDLVEACGRLGGGDGELDRQAERTRQGRRLKNRDLLSRKSRETLRQLLLKLVRTYFALIARG